MAGMALLVLLGTGGTASAGPAEEVAQVAAPRLKALLAGDADAYADAYADDAVFFSSFTPFRIEGKEAIRAYFSQLWQMYPRRQVFLRQSTTRTYGDSVVMQDNYAVLNWTNVKGEIESYDTRGSTTWTKVDGKWKIVSQHISRLPSHGSH